jgi:hypothetical protein
MNANWRRYVDQSRVVIGKDEVNILGLGALRSADSRGLPCPNAAIGFEVPGPLPCPGGGWTAEGAKTSARKYELESTS